MTKLLTAFLLSATIATSAFAGILDDFIHEEAVQVKNITYTDENKSNLNLNDLRGKVIVLNFWATWCAPCVSEMPSLDKLDSYMEGKDVVVLPLSVDFKGAEAVKQFYEQHGLKNLPVSVDQSGLSFKQFELKALPTTIIINKSGKEIARVLGEIAWDEKEVRDYLTGLAKE